MKHIIATSLSTALLGSMLLFGACKKDSTSQDPEPAGVIAGKFSPAAAITTVTATDAASATFTATPAADGSFTISDLKAGSFTVSFTPKTGYAAPANRAVTVTAGQTNDLGTINVTTGSSGSGGSVTYKLDGTSVTASAVNSVFSSGIFVMNAASAGGSSLGLSISGITGPGNFPLGPLNFATGSYTVGGAAWATTLSGSGNINVTTFNTTTRKASGTFNFTAGPALGGSATGNKQVTNGVFTNVSF